MNYPASVVSLSLILAVVACADGGDPASPALSPSDMQQSRAPGVLSDDHCVNFDVSETGDLGLYQIPGTDTWAFGAKPTAITIAGMEGMIYSFVDDESISGAKDQGAHHIVLHHHFVSGENWFQTNDRALCSVGAGKDGKDSGGCGIHDQMRLAEGGGAFDNAAGIIRNMGVVNVPEGWLDLNLSGRICGDGIGA